MSFRPIYKYRDWLPDIKQLDDEILSTNVAAIDELEKNQMLDLWYVSSNPGAITLLERNIPNINIKYLSCNPAAAHLFKNFEKKRIPYENPDYDIDYRYESYDAQPINSYGLYKYHDTLNIYGVALNPQGMHYLNSQIDINKTTDRNLIANLCWNVRADEWLEIIEKRDPDLLDFDNLVNNPNPRVIEIVKRNIKKVWKERQWKNLSYNCSAVDLMRENFEKIDWISMSQNHSIKAIKLLKENPDKIDWDILNTNVNPEAIEMLRANPEKQNLYYLSGNPSAIDLLEEYVKTRGAKWANISFKELATNPAIFTLDTEAMKAQINRKKCKSMELQPSFVEELMEKALKPERMKKYLTEYNYDIAEDIYLVD